MTADRPEAPRLTEIRRRFNGPTIPMPQEDVKYLLTISEAATALLDALQSESTQAFEHDVDPRRVTQQIWAWVNDYPDFDDRPLYNALVSLQNALGEAGT